MSKKVITISILLCMLCGTFSSITSYYYNQFSASALTHPNIETKIKAANAAAVAAGTVATAAANAANAATAAANAAPLNIPPATLIYENKKYEMSPFIFSNGKSFVRIQFPADEEENNPLKLQNGKAISFEFSKTPSNVAAFSIGYESTPTNIYGLSKIGKNETFELAGPPGIRTIEIHTVFSDGRYMSYTMLANIIGTNNAHNIATTTQDNNNKDAYPKQSQQQNNLCGAKELGVIGVTTSSPIKKNLLANLATNVLDRNFGTFWATKDQGNWIQLDLGREKLICNVDIAFSRGNQSISSFTIQTSIDGKKFTNPESAQNTALSEGAEQFGFSDLPLTARYVRITNAGNMPLGLFAIAEIKVLGLE